MIVSTTTLLWIITTMVFAQAVLWIFWDGSMLHRLWGMHKENHDEFFGGIMGMVIMTIGVTGVVLHHLAL